MKARDFEDYFTRLWPICRSLTGAGNRETLAILSEIIPMEVNSVPCGTEFLGWTVPPEWKINEAYIAKLNGEKIIDFKENNLHLVGYSQSVDQVMEFDDLKKHLYTHDSLLNAIPYLTSYYKEHWGFCLSKKQLSTMKEDRYRVFIDSEHDKDGVLNYGEYYLPGDSEKEIVFSTLICHPSLANNELSGPLLLLGLYQALKKQKNRKFSFRFLFLPETIGSILYLSMHGNHMKQNCLAGFMVTCVGKNSGYYYFKKPRKIGTALEGAYYLLQRELEFSSRIAEFNPSWGCDDRQYCSPAYDLPFCTLSTCMQGEFKSYGAGEDEDFIQYHTSLDDISQMDFENMEEVVRIYLGVIEKLQGAKLMKRIDGRCEPFLSNTGLYPTLSGGLDSKERMAAMWLLNYCDGEHDLLWIAGKSGLEPSLLRSVSEKLIEAELLKDEDHV